MVDNWAPLADPFVEGAYATVKGRVRTYVVHRHLLSHLPAPPGRAFDAVLCHGVLMYAAEPSVLVSSLCSCAKHGGVISILALNARSMAVRPAMERRWSDAVTGFGARREPGVLGVDTRADTVEELSELLEHNGVRPEAWYGVWLFSDLLDLAGTPVPDDELPSVAEVELLAGSRDPYRQLSRLFHLLGRRRG